VIRGVREPRLDCIRFLNYTKAVAMFHTSIFVNVSFSMWSFLCWSSQRWIETRRQVTYYIRTATWPGNANISIFYVFLFFINLVHFLEIRPLKWNVKHSIGVYLHIHVFIFLNAGRNSCQSYKNKGNDSDKTTNRGCCIDYTSEYNL